MLQFPVVVTIPGPDGPTVHRPAKVYVADGTTRVYVWENGAAREVANLAGVPEAAGFRQWRLGDVTIASTGGCGCGHPLKRWAPERPIRA